MALIKRSALTAKELAARRANAQKSTGPRTAEGKSAILLNGIKNSRHAPRLAETVRRSAASAEIEAWEARLSRLLKANAEEKPYVLALAVNLWRKRRSMERGLMAMAQGRRKTPPRRAIGRVHCWRQNVTVTVSVFARRARGRDPCWLEPFEQAIAQRSTMPAMPRSPQAAAMPDWLTVLGSVPPHRGFEQGGAGGTERPGRGPGYGSYCGAGSTPPRTAHDHAVAMVYASQGVRRIRVPLRYEKRPVVRRPVVTHVPLRIVRSPVEGGGPRLVTRAILAYLIGDRNVDFRQVLRDAPKAGMSFVVSENAICGGGAFSGPKSPEASGWSGSGRWSSAAGPSVGLAAAVNPVSASQEPCPRGAW
jgi:hypothetical protein